MPRPTDDFDDDAAISDKTATRVRGRPFQPGQSGNPSGRPKLPDDIKKARRLTAVKFERILNKYLYMDRAAFQLHAEQETGMPVIEGLVISLLSRAVLEGDEKRLEFILKRLIGPVKVAIEHTGHVSLEQLVGSAGGEREEGNGDGGESGEDESEETSE